jgi:hypothetical protein
MKNKKNRSIYWYKGYRTHIGLTTLENEWNTNPKSHPAINFWVAEMLKRHKEFLPQIHESLKDYIKDDSLFNRSKSLFREENKKINLQELERRLSIPATLKKAIEYCVLDSSLFNIYDTYMRFYVPQEFSDSEKKVSTCIDKLNKLRPNWAVEEKIVFPDKLSWDMHRLGLDEKPSMNWKRIAAIVSLIVLIVIAIVANRFFAKRKLQ